MECFKQLAVMKFCANGGVMLQNHEIVLVIIIMGKGVVERLFLRRTRDFLEGRADISDDFWSERLRISDSTN